MEKKEIVKTTLSMALDLCLDAGVVAGLINRQSKSAPVLRALDNVKVAKIPEFKTVVFLPHDQIVMIRDQQTLKNNHVGICLDNGNLIIEIDKPKQKRGPDIEARVVLGNYYNSKEVEMIRSAWLQRQAREKTK